MGRLRGSSELSHQGIPLGPLLRTEAGERAQDPALIFPRSPVQNIFPRAPWCPCRSEGYGSQGIGPRKNPGPRPWPGPNPWVILRLPPTSPGSPKWHCLLVPPPRSRPHCRAPSVRLARWRGSSVFCEERAWSLTSFESVLVCGGPKRGCAPSSIPLWQRAQNRTGAPKIPRRWRPWFYQPWPHYSWQPRKPTRLPKQQPNNETDSGSPRPAPGNKKAKGSSSSRKSRRGPPRACRPKRLRPPLWSPQCPHKPPSWSRPKCAKRQSRCRRHGRAPRRSEARPQEQRPRASRVPPGRQPHSRRRSRPRMTLRIPTPPKEASGRPRRVKARPK